MSMDSSSEKDFLGAFDELAPKLYRFCVLRTSSKELSEDLVSQSFMRAWEYLRSGQEIRSYPVFMYKVMRNLIADHWRSPGSRTLPIDDEMVGNIADIINSHKKIEQDAEFSQVKMALEKMPEHHRDILHWRFVDGLSIKEISGLSGKNPNAVYVSIYRSVQNLKKILYI